MTEWRGLLRGNCPTCASMEKNTYSDWVLLLWLGHTVLMSRIEDSDSDSDSRVRDSDSPFWDSTTSLPPGRNSWLRACWHPSPRSVDYSRLRKMWVYSFFTKCELLSRLKVTEKKIRYLQWIGEPKLVISINNKLSICWHGREWMGWQRNPQAIFL